MFKKTTTKCLLRLIHNLAISFNTIFCDAASHILQVTCQDANQKFLMDKKQPNLFLEMNKFEEYFCNTNACEYWPANYFENNDALNDNLVMELYQYGRDNLALVPVLVQSPYITKMKRDVSMTFTSYVANTGGLLRLCLGFSLITGFEMIFWFCCCCKKNPKEYCCYQTSDAIVKDIDYKYYCTVLSHASIAKFFIGLHVSF